MSRIIIRVLSRVYETYEFLAIFSVAFELSIEIIRY